MNLKHYSLLIAGLFGLTVSAAEPGKNLLKGVKAVYETKPTYNLTHDKNDASDLTDGVAKHGAIWFYKSSVGWKAQHCGFSFDLGKVVNAGKIRIHTTSGRSGVKPPEKIYVLGSTDNRHFALLDEIVQRNKFPYYDGKKGIAYWIEGKKLDSKVRYLRFVINPDRNNLFFFLDEVELLEGSADSAELTNAIYPASEIGFVNTLGMVERLEQDIAQIRKNAKALRVSDHLFALEADIRKDFEEMTRYRTDNSDFPLNKAQKLLAAENQRLYSDPGAKGAVDPRFEKVVFSWMPRYAVSNSFTMPQFWNVPEEMYMFPGERRNFAFNLTNPLPKTETVVIRIDSELPIQVNRAVASVTQTQFFNANRLEKIAVKNNTFRVRVIPGETVQIFGRVTVPANETRRHPKVSFVMPDKAVYTIPVTVGSGWQMPETFNTRFGMWDYIIARNSRFAVTDKNLPQIMELIRDSKLDWTWISDYYLPYITPDIYTGNEITKKLNMKNIDNWLSLMGKQGKHFSIFFGIQNKNFVNLGIDPKKDPASYKARIAAFMKLMAKYLKERWGIDPTNVSVLTWDEAYDPEHKLIVRLCAEAIRESNCGFHSFSDAALSSEKDTLLNVEILNPLTPFGKGQLKLYRLLNEKRLAANKNLQWGFYRCNANTRDLDPYTYYGLTFRTGWFFDNFFGGGFWQLSDAPRTLAELDYRNEICCALYFNGDKVYSSKQFESIYEAREDVEYMLCLKKLNKKLAENDNSDLRIEGQRLADEISTLLERELEHGDLLYAWSVDQDRGAFDRIRRKCATFIEKCVKEGIMP